MNDNMLIAVDVVRDSLIITIKMTAPLLLIGMAVGLVVSFVQAITQIQEQTLSFVPKMGAVAGALFVMLPWILQVLSDYLRDLLLNLSTTFK